MQAALKRKVDSRPYVYIPPSPPIPVSFLDLIRVEERMSYDPVHGLQFDIHNPYSIPKLSRAVRRNDLREVKSLLKQGCNPNVPDNRGYTALHEAARSNDTVEIARLLLDAGAYIEHKTVDGQTPLFIACSESCEKIVELLLSQNCLYNNANIDCISPLHQACSKGNAQIISMLVKAGANIDATDHESLTPLYYAIQAQNVEIVKLLLSYRCKTRRTDYLNRSPLQYACMVGNLEIFEILVKLPGFSKKMINRQVLDGWTLLMEAVQFKNYEIAEKLINYGADTSLVDSRGLLALHLAAHCGRVDCLELIIRHTPKDIIERYATPRETLRHVRSLPCLLIDKNMFDGLKLLFECGVSDEVLACPAMMGDNLLSPTSFLFLHGNNIEPDDKVKYIELLLSKDALKDPTYNGCLRVTRTVDAAIRSHKTSHTNCNCDVLLAMLLNEGVDPDVPVKTIPQPFINAVAACYIQGLSLLLVHSNKFEPEDVLKHCFSLCKSPEYEFNKKKEEVIKFLTWASTDLQSVLPEITTAVSSAPAEQVPNILPVFDAVKSKALELPSLKLLCRRTIRIQVRQSGAEANLRTALKTLTLPRALTDFLMYEELLTYCADDSQSP